MPASSSEDLEKRLAALKKSRKGREKRALGSTNRSNEPAMAPAAAAARAPPQQESAADLLFDALDVNHDGVISKEEMVTGLTQQSARMVAPPAPAPAPAVYRPPPAPAPAAYRAPPGDDDSSATRQENHSLREEVDELRRENGHARAQIQDLNGQLDAEKRASRQKVQELEMLLKHVTEELGRQEGGGASSEELMQAHDDIANLEQELHSIERRQAAELRRVRASVSANAGTGEEVELLKKERAARDIVINQLNEELEEAKNGQVARPSAMDALAGKSAGDPEALEYALRELDTAKNEIRNRDRRVEELEREHRNMSFKNEELLHGHKRMASDHEANMESTKDEHGSQVKDLQSELVHVCNVLEAMEEKCKSLEATQINSSVLQEAHDTEEQLKQKVNQVDSANRALMAEREQLTADLTLEREKRTAYETHILAEQQRKQQVAAHLHTSVQQLRTYSMAPPNGQQSSQYGGPPQSTSYGQPRPTNSYAPSNFDQLLR